VEPLDKAVIGERIKFLRKSKGLRQWQMAQMLGATQPAIHKYENGILPEVKRLLEIARIGNTSIEWILTGRHWENGSTLIDRLTPEVYELAYQLQSLQPEDRRILSGAINILMAAIDALKTRQSIDSEEPSDAGPGLTSEALEAHTLRPLRTALAIYEAVVSSLASERIGEMDRFGQTLSGESAPEHPLGAPPLQKNAG
jgi:transcriptional regulator with XRE-family HTH domain